MWSSLREELREFMWLALIVSSLSVVGVTLGAALALAH